MADSPNQAFVQNSAETALLDTLRGRAQLLDQLGSPLPVAKLLYSLCSNSFENAAAVITLMTEKLIRGIMREGPVWGLPREAVYDVTRQPRTLPPPNKEGWAASTRKSRKGQYRRRGGKRGKQQGNPPKDGGPVVSGEGKSLKRDKPPKDPPGASNGTKGSRPPGTGKKGEKYTK